MDETKLTADLPTMNVEIVHRATADGRGEMVTIQLNATPNFRSALPLVAGMAQLPLMLAQSAQSSSPLAAWMNSPLAAWTNSPLAMWTNSPLAMWSNSPLAMWSKGPLAAWEAMMAPWAALAATNPFLALLQGQDGPNQD